MAARTLSNWAIITTIMDLQNIIPGAIGRLCELALRQITMEEIIVKKPKSGHYDRDLDRCKEAYELSVQGKFGYEVAAIIGVSTNRVYLMIERWKQEMLLQETIEELREYRNQPRCF